MINQELLVFIKSQLLKGVDKEAITKELLGSGWAEQDIVEGFNDVNTPINNSTINPVVNPVFSNGINNPILTQTSNNSGKKAVFIIIALFIIAGGASGYYFRNDIPIIKDLIKSNNVPVNEIIQEDNNQAQIEQEETVIPQQEQKQVVGVVNPSVQKPELVIKKEDKSISSVVGTKSTIAVNTEKVNCSQLADKRKQLDCIIKQVSQSGDIKTCDLLDKLNYTDNNEKQEYKDVCYFYSVNVTKDIATCDMLVTREIKDTCYNQVAVLTQDIKSCDLVKDIENQYECYEKIIYINKNVNSCETLKNIDLKNACYDYTAFNVKNFEICNLISVPLSKFECLYKVDISKINNKLCDSLSNEFFSNESKRGSCYSSIAHYNKDPNICKNITEDDEYNGCLYDLIRDKSLLDVKICYMFRSDDGGLKNSCIRDIAVYTKNKSLCESLVPSPQYSQSEIKAVIDSCKSLIK